MSTEIQRHLCYSPPRMSVVDLEVAIDTNMCTLLDVRAASPNEYVTGALRLPKLDGPMLAQNLDQIIHVNQEDHEDGVEHPGEVRVVVVIGEPEEATDAAKLMTATGMRFVCLLAGKTFGIGCCSIIVCNMIDGVWAHIVIPIKP